MINKDWKKKQFVKKELIKVHKQFGKAVGLTEFLGKKSVDECFFTKILHENHTELNVLLMRRYLSGEFNVLPLFLLICSI